MLALSAPGLWGGLLAAGLALLALVSTVRRPRPIRSGGGQDATDAAFLESQHRRRRLAGLVMAAIAAGMVYGLMLDPKASRSQAEVFVATWIGVLVLLAWLLGIAALDWWALRGLARRHRRGLIEEARALAEAERRLRAAWQAGQTDDPTGPS